MGLGILPVWIVASVICVGILYHFASQDFEQQQQQHLQNLSANLDKQISEVENTLKLTSHRLQALSPEDINQSNEKLHRILFSAHQLASVVDVHKESQFLFSPFRNPNNLITRFGSTTGHDIEIPYEDILSNQNNLNVEQQGQKLIVYRPVLGESQQDVLGMLIAHVPMTPILDISFWKLMPLNKPMLKQLGKTVLEELKTKPYGIIPTLSAENSNSGFIRIKGSEQIVYFELPHHLTVKAFLASNAQSILLFLICLLLALLASVLLLQRFLKTPMQAWCAYTASVETDNKELHDEILNERKQVEAAKQREELLQESQKVRNQLLADIHTRRLAIVDQARESVVIITQTIAGENDLALADSDLIRLGTNACQILDHMPSSALPNTLSFEKVNLLDIIEKMKVYFAPEVCAQGVKIKHDTLSAGSIKSDSLLLALLMLNMFRNALQRLPNDGGVIEINVGTDNRIVKLSLIDNGYSIGDRIAAFDQDRRNHHGLWLDSKEMQKIVEQLGGSLETILENGRHYQNIQLPLEQKDAESNLPENVVSLHGRKGKQR